MTPEFDNPRAELEARLTAFILGELPAHDAAALRQTIDDDAELAALYDRLNAAHKLVREAIASRAEPAKESAAPLRLSEARRQKLLAQFKTVAPKEFAPPKPKASPVSVVLAVAAVFAITAMLAGLLLPSLAKSKAKAIRFSVANNLKQIDLAKRMWADENNKSPNDTPTARDIAPYLRVTNGVLPRSVEGETYNIGKVGESPVAELDPNTPMGKRQRRMSLYDDTSRQQNLAAASAPAGTPPGFGARSGNYNYTYTATPAPAAVSEQAQARIVENQSHDFELFDSQKPSQPRGKSPQAVSPTSPSAKTTIVLPPMDNSGNGNVSLTWNTHDGSTQPPVISSVGQKGEDSQRPEKTFYYTLSDADVQDVQRVMQDLFPDSKTPQNNVVVNNGTITSPATDYAATLSAQHMAFGNLSSGVTAGGGAAGGGAAGGGAAGSATGNLGVSGANSYAGDTRYRDLQDRKEQASHSDWSNNWNAQSGDPDWNGFLEHPDQSHSASNLFLSRGSFIAIPQGDNLDVNGIHNQASPRATLQNDGSLDDTFQPTQRQPVVVAAKPGSEFRFYDDLNANGVTDANSTPPPAAVSAPIVEATTGLPVSPLPPEIKIDAKFANITQQDNRALGFNWTSGNFNLGPNVVASGGTQPSFNGAPGAANPAGQFPGAQTFANATTTYDDATKYRQLTQLDDLTAPEVTTESGRSSALQSGEIVRQLAGIGAAPKLESPRAAAEGHLGGESQLSAANASHSTASSPIVTGSSFGGVNGQAAAAYPDVGSNGTITIIDGNPVPTYASTNGVIGRAPKAEDLFALASQAQEKKDYRTADAELSSIVVTHPRNARALDALRENRKLLDQQAGHIPSQELAESLGGSREPVPVRSLNTPEIASTQPGGTATASLSTNKGQDLDTNEYHVNVVGYINLNLTNDSNLIANQLELDGDGKKQAVSSVVTTSTNDPFFSTGQRTSGFDGRLKALGLKSAGIGSSGQVASTDKVPLSGDMPLIGRLFRNTNTTAEPVVSASEVDFATLPANESLPTNVTITVDPETKQLIVSTNYITAQNVATDEAVRRQPDKITLNYLNRQVKEQEDKVDGLRKNLSIVDTDPQSTQPGSSLGPWNIQHYNSLKIESENQYVKQAELLAKLKGLDKEQLKQAIPTAAPDPILSQLLQDQVATEARLVKLKNDLGENHPDVQRTEKLLAENNKQIDSRVKGIVEGIKVSAQLWKAQAERAEEKLNDARTNDIDIANETRPYYEAKEKLEKLRKAQEQLAQNLTKVPAQYAKAADISGALKKLDDDQKNDGHSAAYREKFAELEKLRETQEITALRAAQESVELKMPTTLMVETIEHADGKPAQNSSLGQRIGRMFTGKETQTARIKIERDVTDVPGVSSQPNMSGVYDPYFIQTEFEVIQSEKILDQVIDKLNLDKLWAAQKGSTVPLTKADTRALLKKNLELAPVKNTSLINITVKSDKPEEAAKIANTIAEVYREYRKQQREELIEGGTKAAKIELAAQLKKIAQVEDELDVLRKSEKVVDEDVSIAKHNTNAPIPQPEVSTAENAFSTFSLNISDVSLKLAAASLEKGQMPDAASIRSEEFINAFDYRDPEPAPGAPLGFAWERAQYPFAHNRDLLRFAVKTAATGREPGRPLNIVLLLDKSGSMERADRVRIIHEALRVLATQLQPQDKISVVTFARVARLWVDGLSGSQAAEVADGLDKLTPEGGTNLEEAMRLAYETARRHYLANGINRVVLLTDGAANLGNVDPDALKVKAEEHRKEGIALDCFGVGWEGYNDDLLEVLSRNGGGRYGFINTPEETATDFVGQLAGALNVAAYDVKVQVEFNPKRITNWRQIGYAKHQLTKEQFRDNTVKAAQIAAAESGNGLYAIEVNPNGEGPIATVRVRYRVPGTEDYPEHEYQVPYSGGALPLEQSSPAMRLMGSASAFSEWLASSPFAGEVTTDKLLGLMSGVPETYGADERPKKLEWMIRQAKSLEGK